MTYGPRSDPAEGRGALELLGFCLVGLAALALGGLLIGPTELVQLRSIQPMDALERWWRGLWAWAAWPVALLVGAAGAGLVGARDREPWTLPWRRAVGLELTLLASLALGVLWREDPATGGLVGRALAVALALTAGPGWAAFVWSILGLVGVWTLLRPPSGRTLLGRLVETAGLDAQDPRDVEDDEATQAAPGGAASFPRAAAPPPAASRPPSSARARPAATTSPVPKVGRQALRIRLAGQGARRHESSAARPKRAARGRDLPTLDLFDAATSEAPSSDAGTLRAQAERIEVTLAGFGIPVEVVDVEQGPTFTRFALRPGMVQRAGQPMRVRLSRITSHRHDLALALAAPAIRIEAPIPGRSLVGIEIPNADGGVVGIRELLESRAFRQLAAEERLAIAIGRQVSGEPLVAGLTGMPHLLVAGATGAGKSVFINALLVSLLTQSRPEQLRLILIDPKRVELSQFARVPHLVAAPITAPSVAVAALAWVVEEMEERYGRLEQRGVRDRAAFNRGLPSGEAAMPALVVVIDELADLMMTATETVEPMITRIAQMGRATGIHLVVATQRPSVDVITGLIKANFPSRLAFAVASGVDSRVILDQPGAEALLGQGDLLFQPPDQPRLIRAQGAWVSEPEIRRLLDFWEAAPWEPPAAVPPWGDIAEDPDEALYLAAQEIALANPHLSASLLQRRLKIGFSKAKVLYDRLRDDGFDGGGGMDAKARDKADARVWDWRPDEDEGEGEGQAGGEI